jgi:hypothetical protein
MYEWPGGRLSTALGKLIAFIVSYLRRFPSFAIINSLVRVACAAAPFLSFGTQIIPPDGISF